eukprot:TRINITY_DN35909_c0_g1_i1.p1 TRINITY_DN35909_c0_g1~~TRINITY_DN35909_c0_g1_i1.p1  ORF type:complete len:1142 (-),score=265.05 TRINITY_DN35909_c0_g1_i1:590-3913(-)
MRDEENGCSVAKLENEELHTGSHRGEESAADWGRGGAVASKTVGGEMRDEENGCSVAKLENEELHVDAPHLINLSLSSLHNQSPSPPFLETRLPLLSLPPPSLPPPNSPEAASGLREDFAGEVSPTPRSSDVNKPSEKKSPAISDGTMALLDERSPTAGVESCVTGDGSTSAHLSGHVSRNGGAKKPSAASRRRKLAKQNLAHGISAADSMNGDHAGMNGAGPVSQATPVTPNGHAVSSSNLSNGYFVVSSPDSSNGHSVVNSPDVSNGHSAVSSPESSNGLAAVSSRYFVNGHAKIITTKPLNGGHEESQSGGSLLTSLHGGFKQNGEVQGQLLGGSPNMADNRQIVLFQQPGRSLFVDPEAESPVADREQGESSANGGVILLGYGEEHFGNRDGGPEDRATGEAGGGEAVKVGSSTSGVDSSTASGQPVSPVGEASALLPSALKASASATEEEGSSSGKREAEQGKQASSSPRYALLAPSLHAPAVTAPEPLSVEACLRLFTRVEHLEGDDKWGCEGCTRAALKERKRKRMDARLLRQRQQQQELGKESGGKEEGSRQAGKDIHDEEQEQSSSESLAPPLVQSSELDATPSTAGAPPLDANDALLAASCQLASPSVSGKTTGEDKAEVLRSQLVGSTAADKNGNHLSSSCGLSCHPSVGATRSQSPSEEASRLGDSGSAHLQGGDAGEILMAKQVIEENEGSTGHDDAGSIQQSREDKSEASSGQNRNCHNEGVSGGGLPSHGVAAEAASVTQGAGGESVEQEPQFSASGNNSSLDLAKGSKVTALVSTSDTRRSENSSKDSMVSALKPEEAQKPENLGIGGQGGLGEGKESSGKSVTVELKEPSWDDDADECWQSAKAARRKAIARHKERVGGAKGGKGRAGTPKGGKKGARRKEGNAEEDSENAESPRPNGRQSRKEEKGRRMARQDSEGEQTSADEEDDEEGEDGKENLGKLVRSKANKQYLLSRLPPVLTVHLKRFKQDLRGRLSKISDHVAFSEWLDLRPFMIDSMRDDYSLNLRYRLSGVVEHSGSLRGGHYVAHVRGSSPPPGAASASSAPSADSPVSAPSSDVWYYISDSSVQPTTWKKVAACGAYLLFYERQAEFA